MSSEYQRTSVPGKRRHAQSAAGVHGLLDEALCGVLLLARWLKWEGWGSDANKTALLLPVTESLAK